MAIDPYTSSMGGFDARIVLPELRAAMRILELEQTTVPSVEELAQRVGLSAGYFSRQFAIAFGESPAAYGRRIRLNHAATRLLFAPVRLSEISRSFGFDNQPAFNRAFRRQHGAAPRAFVQHLRKTVPAEAGLNPAPVVHLTERSGEPALCRRFFGPDIAAHWRRFFAELPRGIRMPSRYAGLIHDSPAVVPPVDQRYDCAIPVASIDDLVLSSSVSAGLDAVELPGGIHAEIRGCAPEAIGAAILHLYTAWLPDQPAFLPEGDPMVHWWGEERRERHHPGASGSRRPCREHGAAGHCRRTVRQQLTNISSRTGKSQERQRRHRSRSLMPWQETAAGRYTPSQRLRCCRQRSA